MNAHLNPAKSGALGLLIRHAKREPIPKGESVWVAPLTDEGRRDAVAFGETLRAFRLGGAFSSPIPRCLDTARLILDGWGYPDAPVVDERFLLSAYVADREPARAQFATSDPVQLILDQIAGRKLPGFRSLEAGARVLMAETTSRMREGALTLFVTHDALLMPFRAHLLGDVYSRESWLPFLGNAVIHVDGHRTTVDGVTVA